MRIDFPSLLRAIVLRTFEGIAFLVPVLVLPWTVSPLEINKQALFYFLATIAILAWLGRALLVRTVEVNFGKVWIPCVIFFGCAVLSAVFSPDSYTSIFGQANQEYTSVVTIFFGIALAYVGSQMLDSRTVRRMTIAAVAGAAFVGFIASLTFFGISSDVLPMNLVGMPNALAVYLIVMSLVGSAAVMIGNYDSPLQRTLAIVSTVIVSITALMTLLAVDYVVLWGLAIFGSAALFALALVHPVLLTRPTRFILPMILLVSGLFFSILPTLVSNPFVSEVSLNTSSSWKIATETLQDGHWLFGTGPGTYVADFAKFHSADLNTTSFWDTRFDRASSGMLTTLPTFGVLATIAFILGFGAVSILAILAYRRTQHPEDLPGLIGWLVIFAAWFVYPQNFTLTVLFWILFALTLRSIVFSRRTFSLDRSPRASFIAALIFVVTSVFILTVAFTTVSKYRADIIFARAVALSAGGGRIDDVIIALDGAASANRWSDVYYRNLGSALLQKVTALAKETDVNPELIKSLIGAAVNASIRATELGPTNVTNWELRGDIYREVSPLVADAASFSIAAYQEAVLLAPNNPRYSVDLARGYIAYADVLAPIAKGDDVGKASQAKVDQESALQKASDTLLSAIILKSDYAEARYYLASVQERQGKLAEAVASMELVRSSAPGDVGVGLQLALLYLRQGKNDVAKQELNRVIALAPNFSNAHWYLAAVLEEENDVTGALLELETIMSIDPGNETVQKKIDALRAGQAAAIVLPDPLPSSEVPTLPDATTP
ncbi:MAG: tetratricopeptide repeat protein [Patescibacteria group bacterium]|jgi:tetratricopeptide (TPR) repeat protein